MFTWSSQSYFENTNYIDVYVNEFSKHHGRHLYNQLSHNPNPMV